mgnify:CR=1 FL=1
MEETTARFANLKVVEQKTEESPVATVSFAPGSKTVINETDAEIIDAATLTHGGARRTPEGKK